jgi:hypothetical protein
VKNKKGRYYVNNVVHPVVRPAGFRRTYCLPPSVIHGWSLER